MRGVLGRLRSLAARPFAAFFVVALLLAGCAAPPQEPAERGYRASLLWQVEKDGVAPSYLLGTIHSPDPRLHDLRPEVRQALAASETAAFEMIFDQESLERTRQAAVQPEGRRLEDQIGPELFDRTAAAVRRYGVSPDKLQRMTVLTLVGLLSYPPEELRLLALGHPIFDQWLQQEARRQGKTLRALETDDEQISLFTQMSDAERVAIVSELLKDEAQGVFRRLTEAYLAGDIDTITADMTDFSGVDDVAAAERFRGRLLDDRNEIMVERMIPLMAEGSTFVAVGAGHLGGEAGLLRLLERRGYRVMRLR
jgi:uncharacterized protein YbaP (TraB family)